MTQIPFDDAFSQKLRDLDYAVFIAAKAKGCALCKGRLDTANYLRKTRGTSPEGEIRYSLCCRVEGCRTRKTPRSLRFLGRKVYGAWVVILAVDFCKDLGLQGKIARQTVARWRVFWKDQLSEGSSFIREARALLLPGAVLTDRPASLVAHFGYPDSNSLIPILKFCTDAL